MFQGLREGYRKANETLDELAVRLLAWNSGVSHSVYNVGLSAAKLEENTLVFQNILLFTHFTVGGDFRLLFITFCWLFSHILVLHPHH